MLIGDLKKIPPLRSHFKKKDVRCILWIENDNNYH